MFRRVEPTFVDGDRVLPKGMSLHLGCSGTRAKYMACVPFDALAPLIHPGKCCVVFAAMGDVPAGSFIDHVQGKAPRTDSYDLAVVDDPLDPAPDHPGANAHIEVRVTRTNGDYDPKIRLRPKFRGELEACLAAPFRVCYRPSTFAAKACPPVDSDEWTTLSDGGSLHELFVK